MASTSSLPWSIGPEWKEGAAIHAQPFDLKSASVSMEMASPTQFRGRLKRLLNKKKMPKEQWEVEKQRIEQEFYQTVLSIPGAEMNEEEGMWYCSLQYHDELAKVLRKCGARVGPIPKSVHHIFGMKMFLTKLNPEKQYLVRHLAGSDFEIPAHLSEALFPFQKEGVQFAVNQGGRCLIGDEMGLGKTLQAIAVAARYREDWPVLVICPSSVRMSWAMEFMKWLHVPEADIRVILKGKQPLDGLINIVSYDLTTKVIQNQDQFRMVIVDESHFIKNRTAQRTQAVGRITAAARRVIMLSGTPALSRPEELYNQITFLQPLLFPTFHSYAYRYCNAFRGKFGWDFSGASHSEELNLLLKETMMIRRLKDDVLKELPPKTRNTIHLEATSTPELSQSLDQLARSRKSTEALWTDRRARDLLITKLYRETCRAKIQSVAAYIETFFGCTDDKVIIFAHHHAMLDAIQQQVEAMEMPFIRIDGSVDPATRFQSVDEFQNNPECRVAIISITAGGTGITLNAASKVIFAELYWTPSLLLQAEDRAHRIGQVNHVSVYYLIAKDTFDPVMWNLVKKKIKVVSLSLDGQEREFQSKESPDPLQEQFESLDISDDELLSSFADFEHK